jgi:cellulose biosynthesis protein BcsQ
MSSKDDKDRADRADRADRGEPSASEAPEDVATLYSWANLHGAKYRDFSAPRREHRAQVRATQAAAEAARVAAEAAAQANALPAGMLPAAGQAGTQEDIEDDEPRVTYVREYGSQSYQKTPPPQPPTAGTFYPPPTAQPAAPYQDPYQAPLPAYPPASPTPPPPPFWTQTENAPTTSRAAAAPALDETLQHSRERMASRWFALKGVFDHPQGGEPEPAVNRIREPRVPVLAVFSLAGGVGKTSLVATLGRALASYGERSLLVDASAYGLLPYYFGSREWRPGKVRTFAPPGGMTDAPIHLLSLDPESRNYDGDSDGLNEEILRAAAGMQRVVVDLTTASGGAVRQILRSATAVLVPVVPDLNSIVSLAALDGFFSQQTSPEGRPVQPYYVLNQFDSSLPLHLDVREVLRQQLGDRLLPTVVRRSPAVSEALAEGMTVIDYSASSQVAEDYLNIATWLRSISIAAAASFRGLRWTEK